MIFAIAAISLNLILGYGGMVSFGHAAYLGVGAYAVGILAFYGSHGWLQWPLAHRRLGAGRAGHRRGVAPHERRLLHHDHARLHADALLPRHLARRVRRRRRHAPDAAAASSAVVDLGDPVRFYYVVLALLLAVLCRHRIVNSRFGLVLRAAKSNEARSRAIGFSPYPLPAGRVRHRRRDLRPGRRAAAPTTPTTSRPATCSWTQSGDIMFMVILGGMASTAGPVLGAFALLLLEECLTALDRALAGRPGAAARPSVIFFRRGLAGMLPAPRDG